LSRVGPSGLDYSGRANKYAHHVVLEPGERPEGGPAWLLSQTGFIQTAWEGEPRTLPEGRIAPRGDRPAGVASTWQASTGDAGWAGVLAESFLANPKRPAFLVFQPGMDLLPFFVEAIALLPPARRWEVEFSTYLTHLPQAITCPWRGVLDGSSEAKNARRLPNAFVIDLCRPAGEAKGGALVHLARTGERREELAVGAEPWPTVGPSWEAIPVAGRPMPTAEGSSRAIPPGSPAGYELIPELAARMGSSGSLFPNGGGPSRRKRTWALVAGIVAGGSLIMAAGALLLDHEIVIQNLGFKSATIAKNIRKTQEIKKKAEIAEEGSESKTDALKDASEQPVANAHLHKKKEKPQPIPPKKVGESKDQKNSPPRLVDQDNKRSLPRVQRQGPLIRFIALPEAPKEESHVSASNNRERTPDSSMSKTFPLGKEYNVFGKILNVNKLFRRPDRPDPGNILKIQTQSASLTGGEFLVATFEIVSKGTLSFSWGDQLGHSDQRDELANAVRDLVLTVRSNEGDEDYILLRDLKPGNTKAFELTNRTPRNLDHSDSRQLPLSWTEKSAISGTSWNWGIRRWQIVNRLATEGLKRILVDGGEQDRELKKEFEEDVKNGDVKLKIRIDPAEPQKLRVTLDFVPGLVDHYRRKKEELHHNMAVLKVEREGPYFRLASQPDIVQGTHIYALGFPAASSQKLSEEGAIQKSMRKVSENVESILDESDFRYSITDGIISLVRNEAGTEYIQHSASISGGNSGGPLIYGDGTVLGINTLVTFNEKEPGVGVKFYAVSLNPAIAELRRKVPDLFPR
jgi:hypothetical protein